MNKERLLHMRLRSRYNIVYSTVIITITITNHSRGMTLHWSVFQSPVKTGHEFNLITTLILTSAIPTNTTTTATTSTATTLQLSLYYNYHNHYSTTSITTLIYKYLQFTLLMEPLDT